MQFQEMKDCIFFYARRLKKVRTVVTFLANLIFQIARKFKIRSGKLLVILLQIEMFI